MRLRETIWIPRGEGRAFVVAPGEMLRVKQVEGGGQVGDLNAWNLEDPRERFWGSRTASQHGMHLTSGDQLLSTWPGERPMLTIVSDQVARRRSARGALPHDVMFGSCTRKIRIERYGVDTPGCLENLASAIAAFDLSAQDVHDPLNLFMYTGIGDDDTAFFDESVAQDGDVVDLRADIACLVALSSCPGRSSSAGARGLSCEVHGG